MNVIQVLDTNAEYLRNGSQHYQEERYFSAPHIRFDLDVPLCAPEVTDSVSSVVTQQSADALKHYGAAAHFVLNNHHHNREQSHPRVNDRDVSKYLSDLLRQGDP